MNIITVNFLKKILTFALVSAFAFPTFVNAQILENSDYEPKTEITELSTEETTDSLSVEETIIDFDADETAFGATEAGIIDEKTSVYIETAATSTGGGTWIEASDGRWWYKHADGTYTKNNWEQIDGKWYYFDANGWMLTGWQKINGYWYYFKPGDSGWMVTGWYKIGVNWYYLGTDGKMRTGWQKLDGYWYYFNPGDSGKMLTGWQKISSVWYYLGTDGKMCTGWQQVSGKWYFLGTDGKMRTGWQTINGKKYYFNLGDSGSMVLGWKKIDGYYYYFHSNGVLNTAYFSDSKCHYYFYATGRLKRVEAKVIRQSQQKSNWCWAACASMAGEYVTGTRKTQSAVVTEIKGSAINQGASDEETRNALCFASDYEVYWDYITNPHFDFTDAVELLDAKRVFVMHFEWDMFRWHYLVCSGYDLENEKLQIVDPWANSQTNYYKYSELRHEAAIESGVGWWNGTLRY